MKDNSSCYGQKYTNMSSAQGFPWEVALETHRVSLAQPYWHRHKINISPTRKSIQTRFTESFKVVESGNFTFNA